MIISYNSSYEEVEEFILNHNNSLGAWAETSRAPDSTPIFLPEQS